MVAGQNIVSASDSPGSGNTDRNRKKKRRAGTALIRNFDDYYKNTGTVLGRGAFGIVGAYQHVPSNKEYAVKVVNKDKTRCRFKVLKEIEIYHFCRDHKNIIQLTEFFEDDVRFCLVFEKMEGGTLQMNLDLYGTPSEEVAKEVIRDVASALDYLHSKGIAHRDVKPDNILCTRRGQLSPAKVCDFDLASGMDLDGDRDCNLKSAVGSAHFMAPEVIEAWKTRESYYNKLCDVWSLGVVMYVLLCGILPFRARGLCDGFCYPSERSCYKCEGVLFDSIQMGNYSFPEEHWFRISEDAISLIEHVLVVNPSERFSASDVLHDPWLLSSFQPPLGMTTGHVQIKESCDTFASASKGTGRGTDEVLGQCKGDDSSSRYLVPYSCIDQLLSTCNLSPQPGDSRFRFSNPNCSGHEELSTSSPLGWKHKSSNDEVGIGMDISPMRKCTTSLDSGVASL